MMKGRGEKEIAVKKEREREKEKEKDWLERERFVGREHVPCGHSMHCKPKHHAMTCRVDLGILYVVDK